MLSSNNESSNTTEVIEAIYTKLFKNWKRKEKTFFQSACIMKSSQMTLCIFF
jgi:hypothetical protein